MTLIHDEMGRRLIRDCLLHETDWLVTRHKEQDTLVINGKISQTTLSSSEYVELLEYRQALRDSMQNAIEPEAIEKPIFLG